jgi:hypothetical protein
LPVTFVVVDFEQVVDEHADAAGSVIGTRVTGFLYSIEVAGHCFGFISVFIQRGMDVEEGCDTGIYRDEVVGPLVVKRRKAADVVDGGVHIKKAAAADLIAFWCAVVGVYKGLGAVEKQEKVLEVGVGRVGAG